MSNQMSKLIAKNFRNLLLIFSIFFYSSVQANETKLDTFLRNVTVNAGSVGGMALGGIAGITITCYLSNADKNHLRVIFPGIYGLMGGIYLGGEIGSRSSEFLDEKFPVASSMLGLSTLILGVVGILKLTSSLQNK